MNIYDQTTSGQEEVLIEVLSRDRIGLIGELTTVITAAGADIGSHHAKVFSNDMGKPLSLFKGVISLNGAPLPALLHGLQRVKGVRSVTANDA